MPRSAFAEAQSPPGAARPAGNGHGLVEILIHADPVVKTVIGILVLASIVSWALCFIKRRELRQAGADLKADIRGLTGAPSLAITNARDRVTVEMLAMAADELARSGGHPSHRALEGVEDRVSAQLPIAEARAVYRISWGANILASIGSVSPFVGLTGTVWGIMNSFLGIAQSQSTSLAVVAPGIAEALIATAIGLAVAIPAVLIYNSLTRAIAGHRRLLAEIAVLTACILSREIERREIRGGGGAATPSPRDGALTGMFPITDGLD